MDRCRQLGRYLGRCAKRGVSAALVLGCCLTASPAHAGSAAPSVPADYLPLFVMYSGTPHPRQLQDLKEFLLSSQVPGDTVKDTLETVVFKLNTFKAGFAYPVFRDEFSTSGNACVVADSRHAELAEAWTLLTSERIYRPLQLRPVSHQEAQQLLDNVFDHELFHCYDMVRRSLRDIGQQIADQGPQYFAYWGEVGADAYAALQHLRQHGGDGVMPRIREFRALNLLNGDAVHYTSPTLDYIMRHHSAQSLSGMTTRQLIALADRIREETVLSPAKFAIIQAIAAQMNRDYEALIADYRGLPKPYEGQLMRPAEAPVEPAYATALFAQVRAALRNLGGEKSVGSAYFKPLIKKFIPSDRPLLQVAAYD